MNRPTVPAPAPTLAALLFGFAIAGVAQAAAEPGFVAGISDLPLMGGLVPVPDQDLLFDKPDGRIVQAVARGPVAPGAVRGFYAATLPQLGWRAAGPDRWRRDGEALVLEFPEPGTDGRRGLAALTVRFLLNPQ